MQIIYSKKVQIQRVGHDVALLMRKILTSRNDADKEGVWVVGLDARNITSYVDQISFGPMNNIRLVNPRRAFRTAVLKGAASIVVCQNRLSEDVRPSEEDKFIINTLSRGGGVLGISVLDCVILNFTTYFSFWESGLNDPLYVFKNYKNLNRNKRSFKMIENHEPQKKSEVVPIHALFDTDISSCTDTTPEITDYLGGDQGTVDLCKIKKEASR
jgi:RadC-like JAB domain